MSFGALPRPGVPRPPVSLPPAGPPRCSPPSSSLSAIGAAVAIVVVVAVGTAAAEDFPPERITAGASIFARNCSPCHGSHMRNPSAAFDLRTFPPDEHDRFVSSVTHGKNQMPPWGDVLSTDDIESLWAYVMAGEKTPGGGTTGTGDTNFQFDDTDLFKARANANRHRN
jgi:mono/diheme cytochrome c family protein